MLTLPSAPVAESLEPLPPPQAVRPRVHARTAVAAARLFLIFMREVLFCSLSGRDVRGHRADRRPTGCRFSAGRGCASTSMYFQDDRVAVDVGRAPRVPAFGADVNRYRFRYRRIAR